MKNKKTINSIIKITIACLTIVSMFMLVGCGCSVEDGNKFIKNVDDSINDIDDSINDIGNGSGTSNTELKEAIAAYEDAVDEYVDFMKEYSKASAEKQLEMTSDYTEMMEKYQKAEEEFSGLDTSKLSAEDLEYFNKEYQRITKKLGNIK